MPKTTESSARAPVPGIRNHPVTPTTPSGEHPPTSPTLPSAESRKPKSSVKSTVLPYRGLKFWQDENVRNQEAAAARAAHSFDLEPLHAMRLAGAEDAKKEAQQRCFQSIPTASMPVDLGVSTEAIKASSGFPNSRSPGQRAGSSSKPFAIKIHEVLQQNAAVSLLEGRDVHLAKPKEILTNIMANPRQQSGELSDKYLIHQNQVPVVTPPDKILLRHISRANVGMADATNPPKSLALHSDESCQAALDSLRSYVDVRRTLVPPGVGMCSKKPPIVSMEDFREVDRYKDNVESMHRRLRNPDSDMYIEALQDLYGYTDLRISAKGSALSYAYIVLSGEAPNRALDMSAQNQLNQNCNDIQKCVFRSLASTDTLGEMETSALEICLSIFNNSLAVLFQFPVDCTSVVKGLLAAFEVNSEVNLLEMLHNHTRQTQVAPLATQVLAKISRALMI